MKRFSTLLFAFTIIYISTCITFAENDAVNSGTIRGKALEYGKDQNPIKGLIVTIVSPDDKELTVKTDENGNYKFSNLPSGTYTLKYLQEGFESRGNGSKSVVVVNGGDHVVQRNMVYIKGVHNQIIEPLVHHITENIGQLYHLNNTSVNELRQLINESIETALKYDKSMESIVLNVKDSTDNLETVERLLSHPNTKKAFAKHLNAQQLQDYLGFTKARQQGLQQAYAHLITALLEQSLSLTTDQRTSITILILDALNTDEPLEIEKIAGQSFEKTIYHIDRIMVSSWDNILNKTQLKIWQVMLNMYENNSLGFKDVIGVEVLQLPGEAVVKPHKQQEQLKIKTKEEIQESHLRELTEAVLDAHTEQLGIHNEQALKRLDLAAKGVVNQFVETQNHYANNRIRFGADLANISMALLTGKITRTEAIQKLNTMTKDLQNKEDSNNQQEKDEISRLADQHFIRETIENMIVDRISEIINHPLYQHTIKEVLSADAYAQYSKKQAERNAFLQQASRDVIIAAYDVNLLMNNTQRKHLQSIAAQLTLPCISNEGLIFMLIQMYVSIAPEALSPWQHRQMKK